MTEPFLDPKTRTTGNWDVTMHEGWSGEGPEAQPSLWAWVFTQDASIKTMMDMSIPNEQLARELLDLAVLIEQGELDKHKTGS